MDWQPIETAPTNRTDVMLYCQLYHEKFLAVGYLYGLKSSDGQPLAMVMDTSVIALRWAPLPPPPEGI